METHRRGADGRRMFTAEFKQEQIARVARQELTLAELARELSISASVVRRWHQLSTNGSSAAVGADEDVVPASELRAAQQRIKELERALGTKTKARDRITTIEPWAMTYVRRHARRLFPNDRVFPDLNRWTVSDKHRVACKALDIEDYQLRDSRHTYAVRAIRAGASYETVAQQLGHTDTTMVIRVYGRFRPNENEMRDWHRIAEAQDAKKKAAK